MRKNFKSNRLFTLIERATSLAVFRREARSTLRQQTSAETAQEPPSTAVVIYRVGRKILTIAHFPAVAKIPVKNL